MVSRGIPNRRGSTREGTTRLLDGMVEKKRGAVIGWEGLTAYPTPEATETPTVQKTGRMAGW